MEGFYRQDGSRDREKADSLSFFGGWMGSVRQVTSLLLTGKFQTDWLRLHSWERLKLQLGQVLSLGWLPWGLAQATPFGACCFFLPVVWYILGPQ